MSTNSDNTKLPYVEKDIVYLDYNVFVSAVYDERRCKLLKALSDSNRVIFPFTYVHIQEVNRIDDSERESVQKRLRTIKSITESNYLDFNQSIGQFTIRKRDPFEVFETINEVPKKFIEEVAKYATDIYLRPTTPSLPISCFNGEDLFAHFTRMYRSSFPNLAVELNNLGRDEAIKFIEKKVFSGFPLEDAYKAMTKILKDHGLGEMTYENFLDLQLYISGYKTPNEDLKKPDGLMSDHQHIYFAQNCPVVISDDKNFRRKLRAKFGVHQKLVAEPKMGILMLGVIYGLVVAKDSSGREIDINELKKWMLNNGH